MEPMRVGATAPNQNPPTSGPKVPSGTAVGVGVGAYTSITNIYGPAQAGSGETVNIQVVVRNLASYPIYIAVTGRYNGTEMFPFNPEYANVSAGGSYSFSNSFVMPNKDITLDVWSFYWTGEEWYQDDHRAVSIKRVWIWIPLASATLTVRKAPIAAWIPLASATLSVKKAPIAAWIPLASATLSVKRTVVGAWIALASAELSLKMAIVGGWVPLAKSEIILKKGIVGGWVPLATASSKVGVGVVVGKDIFKSLAVDFEKSMPKEFEKTT